MAASPPSRSELPSLDGIVKTSIDSQVVEEAHRNLEELILPDSQTPPASQTPGSSPPMLLDEPMRKMMPGTPAVTRPEPVDIASSGRGSSAVVGIGGVVQSPAAREPEGSGSKSQESSPPNVPSTLQTPARPASSKGMAATPAPTAATPAAIPSTAEGRSKSGSNLQLQPRKMSEPKVPPSSEQRTAAMSPPKAPPVPMPDEDPEKKKARERDEAEKKRREQESAEFQSRFDLSPTEPLIEDYSCAHTMTGAIYQGRLYLSKNYMCFYSPFFSKLLRINIRKLVDVEKKSTLGVIPNGIEVTTEDGKKLSFISFIYRDQAHATITRLMKDLVRIEFGVC